jgi:hypothetical protein
VGKHLVEYPLGDDGKTVWVEVETSEGDFERISNKDGVEKSAQRFEEAIANIEPATNAVLKLLKKMGVAEGQIEVGLKFSAKAGVILASADSEATFKVTMKWKPE